MARSHHRKKHKAHLRQYQHDHAGISASTPKGKAAWVFTIGGSIIGLAVGYFASDANTVWSIAALIIGAAGGYFAGRRLDSEGKN